jgi:hypothetical protein
LDLLYILSVVVSPILLLFILKSILLDELPGLSSELMQIFKAKPKISIIIIPPNQAQMLKLDQGLASGSSKTGTKAGTAFIMALVFSETPVLIASINKAKEENNLK